MSDDGQPSLTGQLAGGCLIAVGTLMAGLCGLCTFAVVAGGGVSEFGVDIGSALVIGGIPTAVGALLLWGGVRLYRWATPPPRPPQPPANFGASEDDENG